MKLEKTFWPAARSPLHLCVMSLEYVCDMETDALCGLSENESFLVLWKPSGIHMCFYWEENLLVISDV